MERSGKTSGATEVNSIMNIKTFDAFLAEGDTIGGRSVKDDYEHYLTKLTAVLSKEYKVKPIPVSALTGAISDAEDIVGLGRDGLYKITSAKKLAGVLDKVKKSGHTNRDLIERAMKVYRRRLEVGRLLTK